MRKLIFLVLFCLLGAHQAIAQRDTEHWIAPYYNSANGYDQALYLSTDSTVPFDVKIYHENNLVATVANLSKGNPRIWTISDADVEKYLYTNQKTDLFRVVNKGLHLVGDRPFLANVRIAQFSHGELYTLKGKSALGTEFRVVTAPNRESVGISNFTAGIIATEDNTVVTVSGYHPNLNFIDINTTPRDFTFTLNKGQSYILAGERGAHFSTGFIGTKVVATKPIAMVNGNSNGNFGTPASSGSDLIMDQSVPITRLGNTFALVRSLSPIGATTNMEGAIIVATKDNTQIYLNDSTTPAATLNDGQFYRVPADSYINQGNEHYNLFISTNHSVYVYQLVGMDDTYSGGFNYIPPLGCYLPRKIDEIGEINSMPGNPGTITLKLNIVTQPGASVEVTSNGVPVTPQGPFNINGTSDWVTYSVPGIRGNVTVSSTRAVTAGVNGGYSTAGYGGYFAGFSLAPTIEKIAGECIPGISIGVDPIFEDYQWFLDGNPVAGATSNTITPTQPGNYTLRVLLSGCDYVMTDPYKVYPCTYYSTINETVCEATKTIPVRFSVSTQTVDTNSIEIVSNPANGTVTINPFSGTIIYTPNPNFIGQDSFKYKFKSTIPEFGDNEEITINLNVVRLTVTNETLTACPYNGIANYDLTGANVTNYVGVTKKYYKTLSDAQQDVNPIAIPASYDSASGDVFVRVTTPEGCVGFAKITLVHNTQPILREGKLTSCFIEGNPTAGTFDLTSADIGAGANFTKVFFASLSDAENNRNPIATPQAYISPSTYVYARVYNGVGCFNITKINLIVSPPKYSEILKDVVICVENKTILDAGAGFDGYTWSTGETTASISNVTVGEYWVDLLSNGCVTRQKVRVIKAPEPVVTQVDISNDQATISVIGGTPPYQYSSDGIVWQDSNVLKLLKRGKNQFYIKDAFNCKPVTTTTVVPNFVNAITPNDDGINDVVDYSELSSMPNFSFVVYDRYGSVIFEGNKQNNYIWNGLLGSKKVPTGNYWYTVSWEAGSPSMQMKYSGWIVVKNVD